MPNARSPAASSPLGASFLMGCTRKPQAQGRTGDGEGRRRNQSVFVCQPSLSPASCSALPITAYLQFYRMPQFQSQYQFFEMQ